MQPGEVYLKAKRWMVLCSGVLALAVLGQIHYVSDNKDYVLGLKDPTQISNMLAIAVLYFLFQSILYWQSQEQKIKSTLQFRVEMLVSFAIAIIALSVWFVDLIFSILKTYELPDLIDIKDYADLLVTLFVITLAVLSIITRTAGRITGRALRNELQDVAIKHAQIVTRLSNENWTLIFNPHRRHGHKKISFNADGTIGAGQNENEHNWRVDGVFLEILDDQGEIFSRFTYHPIKNYFQHTNDPDTRSIRDQLIVPIENLYEWTSELARNF